MAVQFPYFPYHVIDQDYSNVKKAVLTEPCYWNVKFKIDGDCHLTGQSDLSSFSIYAYAEILPVEYVKTVETEEDGYGTEIEELVKVDRIFGMEIYTEEIVLKYIYEMLYGSKFVKIEWNGGLNVIGNSFEIKQEELSKSLYKLEITYKQKNSYHTTFGLSGCCLPLYEEAPYEDPCDTIGSTPPPGCTGVSFSVTKSGNTLTGAISGGTNAHTIGWYFRANETSPWSLLIASANSISIGPFGTYRAVCNYVGCGQFTDQYLHLNPCQNFDVKIRKSGIDTLIAEMSNSFPGITYAWERFNGATWVTLVDTTSSIVVTQSGNYRVTASHIANGCSDQDVYNISLNSNPLVVDLTYNQLSNSLSAFLGGCTSSPTYYWQVDKGNGFVAFGSFLNYGPIIYPDGTGYYKCIVECDGHQKEAVKMLIIQENCTFGIVINRNQKVLNAITTATSPTYLWEYETEGGIVNIGNTSNVTIQGSGVYRCSVTSGTCTNSEYYIVDDSNEKVVSVSRVTGFEFTIYEIDLLSEDPAGLVVTLNGVNLTYTSNTPVASGFWSKNNLGKMTIWSAAPANNAVLKVIKE